MVIASVKQDMMATKSSIFFMAFPQFDVYVVFMIFVLVCFDDTKMRRQTTMAKKSALLNRSFRTA